MYERLWFALFRSRASLALTNDRTNCEANNQPTQKEAHNRHAVPFSTHIELSEIGEPNLQRAIRVSLPQPGGLERPDRWILSLGNWEDLPFVLHCGLSNRFGYRSNLANRVTPGFP
jgi:hypothetical protein